MRFLILIIFSFIFLPLTAQKDRKAVVLDMTSINSETNASRLISVHYLLRSAGIPFETTDQIDSAILYPVIITGSRLENDKLSSQQQSVLQNYISGGGVFITSSMRDSSFFTACGISGYISEDTLYSVEWDISSDPFLFEQINDSLEKTVSLGDSANGPTFFTRGYILNTALSYGNYENGISALAVNQFGNGTVYTFGPDLRDIYIRNLLDYDVNAHRTYSNGFEPGSDVFMFIIRNIIRKHIPNSVYSYPVPGNYKSVVMLTHDIDSESALDTMLLFADFETQRNIIGQYNITTRYFNDGWMTSFYVGSVAEIQSLVSFGHVVSSHSVGHFPDFAEESIFPFGQSGNDPTNYQPYYTGGITTGGSVMGELEVSKELLEDDHQLKIRSFRAGHLAFHDSLITGLDSMHYEFNSTHSANNILTGFPFYNFYTRSFSSAESPVLEIPMTISDVFNSDPINSANYMQKVALWIQSTKKYSENNAPVNLLIHPNRMYKLTAETAYLDSLENDIKIINMETYGEFWRKRDSLRFHTEISNDTLLVWMDNQSLHDEQSFVIDTIGINTVIFKDINGQILSFQNQPFSASQKLYFRGQESTSITEIQPVNLILYPNPASQILNIVYDPFLEGSAATIYDITGKKCIGFTIENDGFQQISLLDKLGSKGMYYLIINHKKGTISKRFIFSGTEK
jgi:hypothetical protein